jgi:hypothetical protein
MDGKLKISQTTFPPGVLTLVVSNRGKLPHGLAIMGAQLKPKETPTIGSGKSAKLTVKLGIGVYHIWDPVRSGMSHATMLMVKAAKTGTTPSTAGNPTMSGGAYGASSSGTDTSGAGDTSTSNCGQMGGMNMPGMDPNSSCSGMGGM